MPDGLLLLLLLVSQRLYAELCPSLLFANSVLSTIISSTTIAWPLLLLNSLTGFSAKMGTLSFSLVFSFFLDLGILIFFVFIYLGEYVVSTNELAYLITFLE